MPTTGNNTLGTGQYIQIGFSFRYLSKPELVERLHSLKHQNRISKLKIDRLKAKLTAVIKSQSISLDQGTSDDMMQMMLQQEDRVAQFPEGSFQQVLFQQLYRAASLESCEDWQKFVCLLLDEMYVRENLVYNKSTGRLVGFCDLGEVNNHLLAFERSLQDSGSVSRHPPLAKTIMVIMVRGLFTPLRLLNLRR